MRVVGGDGFGGLGEEAVALVVLVVLRQRDPQQVPQHLLQVLPVPLQRSRSGWCRSSPAGGGAVGG